MSAPTRVPIPACPASPLATRRFSTERWGAPLDDPALDGPLKRRARAMVERRTSGDARGADVLGWLTLSALLAGARPALVTALVKATDLDALLAATVADTDDQLGEIAGGEPGAEDVEVAGVTVPDVGSRRGWALACYAGSVSGAGTVTVGGLPVPAETARAQLVGRIKAAERGTR